MARSIFLLAILSAGCRESALDAVKEMRRLACNADPAAFFSHVDRNAIADAEIAVLRAKEDSEASKLHPLLQASYREGAESGIPGLRRTVEESLAKWEDDIKRGNAGDLCQMSIVDAKEVENTADVHFSTPSGKDRTWRLSRFDKSWLVVKLVH